LRDLAGRAGWSAGHPPGPRRKAAGTRVSAARRAPPAGPGRRPAQHSGGARLGPAGVT